MEQRFDSIPLSDTYFTPEGYLIDNPILTRVGIFEYHNADGSVRRELRLPEEVFAAESLASYKGKPVILTHEAGLVDVENVQQEHIGTKMCIRDSLNPLHPSGKGWVYFVDLNKMARGRFGREIA